MSDAPRISGRDLAIWLLISLFAVFNVAKRPLMESSLAALVPPVSILSMLVFVALHGARQIGWRRLGTFFALAFVVSFAYESLSIATGFPFGHYHYSDHLGPKLGTVPLLIMPAYFSVCYVSWHLARLLIDRAEQPVDGLQTWALPPLAALIMVMWDMSMDPARATVHGAWIWHQGGGYMGVPFSNFMGWALCVWTIFQLFALVERRGVTPEPVGQAGSWRGRWLQVVGLYGALTAEFVVAGLFPPDGAVVDPTGQVWRLRDLYETLGLVAIFSMGFVTLLSLVKVLARPATS